MRLSKLNGSHKQRVQASHLGNAHQYRTAGDSSVTQFSLPLVRNPEIGELNSEQLRFSDLAR